jgi:phosphatidylserine/phosphatidylglycerophosphate/cardiolipin synthase-like enzyme
MLGLLFRPRTSQSLIDSKLCNEQTFYEAFLRDLRASSKEIVIESPFMTTKRVNGLITTFSKLKKRGVAITINTRDPQEHEPYLRTEAINSIAKLQKLGVRVLYTGNHHRKLAIIDREVMWEGSLNILSQNNSCEIMRRIHSRTLAQDMLKFIKLEKFLV